MVKSMKPGKQRKAHFNAPMHEKRKRVAARLQLAKPDARFDGVRTVTVRVGDVVQVTRGDHAHGGKRKGDPLTGAVLRVDAEKGRLYIEGVKASKADNKEEAVPVHVSNVVVTQLDESDRFRIAKLTGNRS